VPCAEVYGSETTTHTCCLWQGPDLNSTSTGCCSLLRCATRRATSSSPTLTSAKRAAKCLRLLCAEPAVIKLKVPLGTRACSNTHHLGQSLLLTTAPVADHYAMQTFCCRCGSMSTSKCRPSWAVRHCSTSHQ
jgi:hypothetical protein